MTLRTKILLPTLLLLAACKDGGGIDDTADTQDTETQEVELDPELAYIGSQLPMGYAVVAGFLTLGGEEGCPSAVETGEGETTLTGGCTDEEGAAWTGTAVLTETGESSGGMLFTDFGTDEVRLDGSIAIDTGLTANLDVSLNRAGNALELSYTDYGVDNWEGYGSALFGSEGSSGFSGQMAYTLDGASVALTASGSMSNADACSDEFDSGTLTLSGHSAGDVVYTWDGVGCDGCADWAFNGETGTACD